MNLDGKKIVAIDDTSSIRTFLRVSLEDEGAKFYEASTAAKGLQLCRRIKPDMVVLDLGLPDKDGLDLLPEIIQDNSCGNPFIIVLTVRKTRSTIEEAYARGANAYLTKPFMVEDLMDIIEAS